MKNLLYYITTIAIWGTTWLAIKFQLGSIAPMVSVFYRFLLASLLLLLYCKFKGLNMRFTKKEHVFIAMQGFFLFAVNYLLFYTTEVYLSSGLTAVIFSTIVFMNIFNGKIFLHSKIQLRMVLGAMIGLGGITLVFLPELSNFSLDDKSFYGLLLGIAATFSASIGNIISAHNQKKNLPVIQTNAYGMAYGSFVMLVFALITNKTFQFDFSVEYIVSLGYLAVFGSVIAFGCYLTLIGRIGADRAAYATMLFPLVALGISTIFEGYIWTTYSITGIALIVAGNLMIISKKKFRFVTGINKWSRV
jgi:drug/metabolite transporter (DMT)-like permease